MWAFNSEVAFGKLWKPSELQFTLWNILKLKELIPVKYLEQFLAHCKLLGLHCYALASSFEACFGELGSQIKSRGIE